MLFIAPLQINAMTVSISPATVQAFTQLSATGSPVTIKTSEIAAGAGFTTVWSSTVSGINSANIGQSGLGLNWSGFDTFSLNLANDNENAWSFSISVSDGTTAATSTVQVLPNNSVASLFSVDITGLDLTTIDSVYLTVSADLPINGIDRTAEYTASAVPVPAAVWLFGSALGLLGWLRRRTI